MPEFGQVLNTRKAGLWSLVLQARNVPHRVQRIPSAEGGGNRILVQSWQVDRAAREITLYEQENPKPESDESALCGQAPAGDHHVVLFMGLLVLFHFVTTMAFPALGIYPRMWNQLGSAEASLILEGQWWRIATALTLHADGAHVLGNAFVGAVFLLLLCRRVGLGPGWLFTIVGGCLGNLVNALVLGPPHNAIGFSTAVFSVAGLLAGTHPFVEKRGSGRFHSLLKPVAAGLGLLAMLGTGGENTDLGAHLFGFVSGLALGFLLGGLEARFGRPGRQLDHVALVAGFGILALGWALALAA